MNTDFVISELERMIGDSIVGRAAIGLIRDAASKTESAPPVLSARPNEAECPECKGTGQVPIDEGYGGDAGCTNACSPPEPPTLAMCEECFGSGKVTKTEADAPRGKAVAPVRCEDPNCMEANRHNIGQVNTCVHFDFEAACARLAPPPSPVGEAAGVREISDSIVVAACTAAYSACDMGPFPSQAVDPENDLRFVRAAIEVAERAWRQK